jgi:hypothetical protein
MERAVAVAAKSEIQPYHIITAAPKSMRDAGPDLGGKGRELVKIPAVLAS